MMDVQQADQQPREARRLFSSLRSLCKQLLDDPNRTSASIAHILDTLASQLRDVSPDVLQGCLEYVLFPLLLLLDSAVATRSSTSSGEGSHASTARLRLPNTDKIIEGVVVCVELVLKKCSLQDKYQMVTVLKSLSAAAMLTPAEASEEFRHGVVRCLKASFLSLQSCGDPSCRCSASCSPPQHGYGDGCNFYAEHVWTRCFAVSQTRNSENTEACHVAYLQSEDMRVAIGHLFSVLLKIAETEASLGGVGSAKLRVDALSTLRAVLWKVGSAEVLSFFLPGVVSSLSKGMQNANFRAKDQSLSVFSSTPSFTLGAGGSSGALAESVRCIGDIIVLVLGDLQNTSTCHNSMMMDSKAQAEGSACSAGEALERLRAISLSSKDGPKPSSEQPAAGQVSLAHDGGPYDAVTSRHRKPAAADFQVERNASWLQSTAIRINSILSRVLPAACSHSTPAVRLAVADFTGLLLGACATTLQICSELLLECLLSLACDEWKPVAMAACSYLAALVSSSDSKDKRLQVEESVSAKIKVQKENLLAITSRLLMGIPRAMYSADEHAVDLHARKLAAAMYFAGAEAVSNLLLNTPVTSLKFVTVMSQAFSFSTAFSGSMSHLVRGGSSVSSTEDHLEVEEFRSKRMRSTQATELNEYASNKVFHQKELSSACSKQTDENICSGDHLPRAPPWLNHGGDAMYKHMSCILRLTGLSAIKSKKSRGALTTLLEPLLAALRQVTSYFDGYDSHAQNLARRSEIFDSGYQIREAAGAAALINEIVYGSSGAWTTKLVNLFEKPALISGPFNGVTSLQNRGETEDRLAVRYHFQEWTEESAETKNIVTTVGNVLHEFMEIWNVLDASIGMSGEMLSSSSHVLYDILMLEQILVEGVGVCAISLGKAFDESGLLGSVLCPLLERLGSSYYNVSHAADIVLQTISSRCGYSSVKTLVKANADHIVDSLCRQLRHTQLHPNAPRLLAAILRHTGAAPDFVPLLDEPIRSIQIELEIPARQQHPDHVVPLLLGMREVSKAVKDESNSAAVKAQDASRLVQTILSSVNKEHDDAVERLQTLEADIHERNQYSRAIGALALSCMVTCSPLLSAKDQQVCLLALDTVEHSIGCLADLEVQDNLDKSTKIRIKEHKSSSSSEAFEDGPVDDESGNTGPKLLPSMHRLWPHLVLCLRHSKSPVVIRALAVMAHAIVLGGGEFFNRRMKRDALPLMVKLLCNQRSSVSEQGLLLQRSSDTYMLQQRKAGDPYGRKSYSSPAEVLKVQQAVIACVTSIANSSKSAPALTGLVSVVASWILVLGCSVSGLQDIAADALLALSAIDADVIWVLAADLAFGAGEATSTPGLQFPPLTEIFPPLGALKDALCLQYISQSESVWHVDRSVAGTFLAKLNSTKDG